MLCYGHGNYTEEDEFEDVGPADFDYLKKHVMQCYHKEDEEEISGDARNRSATKTKLNRGFLEEDLKIELIRRLKSTTQADGDLGLSPGRIRWWWWFFTWRESSACGLFLTQWDGACRY